MWKRYYELRAQQAIAGMRTKNMNGWFFPTRSEAKAAILDMVPPGVRVACGDSMTVDQIGVIEALRHRGKNDLNHPMERNTEGEYVIPDRDARTDMQRQAVFADIFLSGTNAITLDGSLVNTDGMGNRVAPMIFGPKKVIVVAGANKIVGDLEEAIGRVRNVAGTMNALRHVHEQGRTEYAGLPCVVTGACNDCTDEARICRATVILDGSSFRQKGRINVVIVGEELGL